MNPLLLEQRPLGQQRLAMNATSAFNACAMGTHCKTVLLLLGDFWMMEHVWLGWHYIYCHICYRIYVAV